MTRFRCARSEGYRCAEPVLPLPPALPTDAPNKLFNSLAVLSNLSLRRRKCAGVCASRVQQNQLHEHAHAANQAGERPM